MCRWPKAFFQPEIGDFVSVPGEWNNWSTVDQLVPIDGMPGFYDGVINVRGVEGQTAEYKFLMVSADGRGLPSGGWELFTDPLTGMEDIYLNRSFTLGPNDETYGHSACTVQPGNDYRTSARRLRACQ